MLYTQAQQGDHIEEILGLLYQIALRDSRIPVILPGREFTEEAGLAVRAYQQAYGLPVTGEIDTATWDSIVQTYRRMTDRPMPLTVFPAPGFLLRPGDRGEMVSLVQVLFGMIAGRYDNLPAPAVTGEYDAETAEAVRVFQQIAGVPVNGILGRETWNRLAALIAQTPLRI